MMKTTLEAVTVMGFARYEKRKDIETEQLIDACLNWRREFLEQQEGIAMHCFLGNLKGQFADAIMAVDQHAFQEMSKRHLQAESSQRFMALLEPDSIRLSANDLLKKDIIVPENFSCIEYGTFQPKTNGGFSETKVLEVSRNIETQYLSGFSESRAHIMGKVDNETYSEIAFVQTLGSAREICNGYLSNEICGELLEMFDPETVDLDFWHVLA